MVVRDSDWYVDNRCTRKASTSLTILPQALARAVYADAPILLLDDVLSALDGETEKHVFDSLFAPGGLVRDKTVVLATHNSEYNATNPRTSSLMND